MNKDKLTLGVEEEYLIVDPKTREAAGSLLRRYQRDANSRYIWRVNPEEECCESVPALQLLYRLSLEEEI